MPNKITCYVSEWMYHLSRDTPLKMLLPLHSDIFASRQSFKSFITKEVFPRLHREKAVPMDELRNIQWDHLFRVSEANFDYRLASHGIVAT